MRIVARSGLLVGLGILLLGGVLLGTRFDRVVLAVLAPRTDFEAENPPPPPRYDDPTAWSALPGRVDAADAEIATLPRAGSSQAPVDVFYVHPTSYVGTAWNARLDDETVNAATDQGATRLQASAFNACCSVYAPRYRQANLTAFVHPSPDGARAIALAGDDVLAAFRHYLDHDNGGRPFLLAAHSQGSVHALRLLTEVIVSGPAKDRLVVAYLIGGPLTEATLARTAGLPVCATATQTGCVVGWNARSPAYRNGIDFLEGDVGLSDAPASPRVCVNPLTWRHDEEPAGRALNHGAVFFDASSAAPVPIPSFANARCENGTLRVEPIEAAPRDFMSRLLDHALGDGNFHPIEYGLFFVNLRENAQQRIDAYQAEASARAGSQPSD